MASWTSGSRRSEGSRKKVGRGMRPSGHVTGQSYDWSVASWQGRTDGRPPLRGRNVTAPAPRPRESPRAAGRPCRLGGRCGIVVRPMPALPSAEQQRWLLENLALLVRSVGPERLLKATLVQAI